MEKPDKKMTETFDQCADSANKLRDCHRYRIWRGAKLKELLDSGQSIMGLSYDPISETLSFQWKSGSDKVIKDIEYPIILSTKIKDTEFN